MDEARALGPSGRVTFHLRLDPPDLGPVQVHLTAGEHGISARLVVQEAATRQALQGQMPLLRQRLQEAGVSLHQLDLTSGNASSGGRYSEPQPRRTPAPGAARRGPAPAGTAPTASLIDVVA